MNKLEIISITKTNFKQDAILWLRLIILCQLIFLGGGIYFIVEQINSEPKPLYFPIKQGDQLIDSVPLGQPMLTDAELLNWVTEAMLVSFSFNYHNYVKVFDKIDEYFDPIGLNDYKKILDDSEQIQQLKKEKLILSGKPTAAPRILNDGIVDGRYAWEIELPFILRFENQNNSFNNLVTMKILVVRVSEKIAPLGVKIIKLDFKI